MLAVNWPKSINFGGISGRAASAGAAPPRFGAGAGLRNTTAAAPPPTSIALAAMNRMSFFLLFLGDASDPSVSASCGAAGFAALAIFDSLSTVEKYSPNDNPISAEISH